MAASFQQAAIDVLISKTKRAGRDGITARAFENAIHYVFANTVGTQVGGKWSSGDSKIVAPDGRFLRLADNDNESVLTADLNPAEATRKYALDGLQHPKILARYWPGLLQEIRKTTAESDRRFLRDF